MKLRNLVTSAAVAFSAMAIGLSQPASAAVLYDNGPLNGAVDAFTINYGYAVSDSFTLTHAATVAGVNFGVWSQPGDTMSAIDWAITANASDYNPADAIGIGTAAVTTNFTGNLGFGYYSLAVDNFSTGSVNLAAGTYYLVLQNAATNSGNPIYWDESDGASSASDSGIGNLANFSRANVTGSESFQILSGAVPEPSTWAMMMVGFGGLGAAMRSRRKMVVAAA